MVICMCLIPTARTNKFHSKLARMKVLGTLTWQFYVVACFSVSHILNDCFFLIWPIRICVVIQYENTRHSWSLTTRFHELQIIDKIRMIFCLDISWLKPLFRTWQPWANTGEMCATTWMNNQYANVSVPLPFI